MSKRYQVMFGYGNDEWNKGEFDSLEEARSCLQDEIERTVQEHDGHYYVLDNEAFERNEDFIVDGTWVDVRKER